MYCLAFASWKFGSAIPLLSVASPMGAILILWLRMALFGSSLHIAGHMSHRLSCCCLPNAGGRPSLIMGWRWSMLSCSNSVSPSYRASLSAGHVHRRCMRSPFASLQCWHSLHWLGLNAAIFSSVQRPRLRVFLSQVPESLSLCFRAACKASRSSS